MDERQALQRCMALVVAPDTCQHSTTQRATGILAQAAGVITVAVSYVVSC